MDDVLIVDDPYIQAPIVADPLARVRRMLQTRAENARLQPPRRRRGRFPRASGSIYACPGKKLCRTCYPDGDE